MENYSYTTYPESGDSSPRSREIDFDNPQPWDDLSNTTYKVKLMCSYGGKIHPRPHDNQLSYVGGETKILAVDRSIKFSSLISKLSAVCEADVCFKYQLPGEDLDALISVTDDDDLDHMMNEYDRLNRASSKPARLRLFLFPVSGLHVQNSSITSVDSFGSARSDRERFVDALNSGQVPSTIPISQPTHGNADFLFGKGKEVIPPVVATAAKVKDLPVGDPPNRHHEIPNISNLDDRDIGADRIQKHIQDLRRLRIAEDQQQQQQNMCMIDENKFPPQEIYAADYFVQRTTEKSTIVSGPVSSPAPGYQIAGGYKPQPPAISAEQQPVYKAPASASVYHAPIARPVTGSVGQSQGYYAVQRMPTEVYPQPVYNNPMQPAQSVVTQPVFPPQQQQPQKMVTEGIRMVQSTAGMIDAGYGQVAYDSGVGRHVYYTAQGSVVTPVQQPPLVPPQVQQTLQPQPPLQPVAHQYQAVAAGGLSQDGKVIGANKITQGPV